MNRTALLLPLLLFSLSCPTWGDVLPTKGLTDYQVVQRNEKDQGDLTFSGTTDFQGEGALQAAVFKAGQVGEVLPWKPCGTVKGGLFEARINGVPTGGPYEIRLRALEKDGEIRDQGKVEEVLVGDLWILAGQSNMEGCGILSRGAVPPHRLVHCFDLADRWLMAEEPLHWKWESVDTAQSGPPGEALDKRRVETRKHRWRGGGLGLPFARRMVERTGVPVGLLACSLGGTSMARWSPALMDQGGASLYGSMIRRFQKTGGKVRGVLWYQGEADALENGGDTFEENFTSFVAAIRKDFFQPHLPFYYVQLGRYLFLEHEEEWSRIRDLQLKCESLIHPPVGMVAAVDQPLVDAIHVRTSGLKTIGERLALLACRDLLGEDPGLTGPRPHKIRSHDGYPQRIVITFTGMRGSLKSAGPLSGFSVRDKEGKDLRMVFDQFISKENPSEVILECQYTWSYSPLPEEAFIYYGFGNDPYCNLEDEAGQAAPCFGPLVLPKP